MKMGPRRNYHNGRAAIRRFTALIMIFLMMMIPLLQVASNGRNVFMGYLGDATKTRETFDRGFWLLSGDMATIDQGFVTIKGES